MKKLIGIAFAGAMLVACAGGNRNTKMEDTTAQGTYEPPPPTAEQPNSTSDQNAPGSQQQSPPTPSPTETP